MRAFLITVGSDDHDRAVERFWELGTLGAEEREAPVGELSFLAYFDDETVTAESLRSALAADLFARVTEAPVPEVDWVARFRENFRAFAAAGFWIAPAWDVPPAPPAGHRLLVVDPGRAFGTGTHESTALCLSALTRLAEASPLGRTADVGTGTGILAIAALKLGASLAVGSDCDPEAVASAREHARLNQAAPLLLLADGARAFAAGAFDTVVANITAPLLVERASEIGTLVRRGGRIVLAGLLAEERTRVCEAYARFGRLSDEVRGEWASLLVASA